MRSPLGTRLAPGVDHLPQFLRGSGRGPQVGEHTWKRPRPGDCRGTPCGRPPGSQRSPAGWSGHATGPARSPGTTRGVRRRVPGRATTRVAPTMWWSRATRLGRASIIIPNSPGDQAGGPWWTWKRPPIRDRRGTPCGCPPGSQRSPAGRSCRATGPVRHPVSRSAAGSGRVQGEGDHKGRPYDAVAAGDAVGAGRRSPSPIPQGIRPEVIVGGGPGNVHRSGTVGAPLVGALRRGIVRRLGGGAVQPGRQGARPRPVVDDAVCRRGRPQGSPLRCGGRGRRVWAERRSSFPIPQGVRPEGTGGPGNVRRSGTVGAPLVGALRGRNVRRLGGRATQPGRQGARSRPAVCDVVCRGGRPQGSPLRCGGRGRRVWAERRSSSSIPQGIRPEGTGGPGNVRRSGTVGAPLVGALRGRNIRRLGGRAAQPGR